MEEPSLEALMQAGLIFVVGVAIILSNLLIIATYLNFRGECFNKFYLGFQADSRAIDLVEIC